MYKNFLQIVAGGILVSFGMCFPLFRYLKINTISTIINIVLNDKTIPRRGSFFLDMWWILVPHGGTCRLGIPHNNSFPSIIQLRNF